MTIDPEKSRDCSFKNPGILADVKSRDPGIPGIPLGPGCDCLKSNFPRWSGADSQGAEVMHTITSAELQSCQKYSGPQIPPSKHNASFLLARIHITRLQVLITYYVFFRNFQERCKSEISPKMQDEAEDLSDGHGADGDYHNDQDGANLHYY